MLAKKGDKCTSCGKGTYVEYSINSDLFGEYLCCACGHMIYTEQ